MQTSTRLVFDGYQEIAKTEARIANIRRQTGPQTPRRDSSSSSDSSVFRPVNKIRAAQALRNNDLTRIVDVAQTIQTDDPTNRDDSDNLYDRLCQLVNAPTMLRRQQLLTLVSQFSLPLINPLIPQWTESEVENEPYVYHQFDMREYDDIDLITDRAPITVEYILRREVEWQPKEYRPDSLITELPPPPGRIELPPPPDFNRMYRMDMFLENTRPVLRRLPYIPFNTGNRNHNDRTLHIVSDEFFRASLGYRDRRLVIGEEIP